MTKNSTLFWIALGLIFVDFNQPSANNALNPNIGYRLSPKHSFHQPGVTYISTVAELQNIRNNLAGNYVLANDIPADNFNFAPIGTYDNPFTGSLNGNGFSINNLTITAVQECVPSYDCAGLFGYVGTGGAITGVRMGNLNISVTCTRECLVGGFAAWDTGIINSAFAQGDIVAQGTNASTDLTLGGIAGASGNLSFDRSNVAISVSGAFCNNYIGGLVGLNGGSVEYAASLGSISASNTGCSEKNAVGGMVGENDGTISDSYAADNVTDNMSSNTYPYDGGFAGQQSGTVLRSFATGSVTSTNASSTVGGFAGFNYNTTKEAFASGLVESSGQVTGGFVGIATGYGSEISQSYATGSIKASSGEVGGFAGDNASSNPMSSSYWDIDTSGTTNGCGEGTNCSAVGLHTSQMQDGKLDYVAGFDPHVWMPVAFPMRFEGEVGEVLGYPALWNDNFPLTTFPLAKKIQGTLVDEAPYGSPTSIPPPASINTVFDHSMPYVGSATTGGGVLYRCDNFVVASDEATGQRTNQVGCKYTGYPNTQHTPFDLGGVNYTGGGDKTLLNYDGHPGTDFRTIDISTNGYGKAPVFAAVSGTLFYPWEAVGLTGNPYHAYCFFHALGEVPDQQRSYRLYYLHLWTHPAGIDVNSPPCNSPGDTRGQQITITDGNWIDPSCVYTDQNGKSFTPASLPLLGGTHVEVPTGKLCVIAVSGDAGVPGSPHLHFEIQQIVPLPPYGPISPGDFANYFSCYNEDTYSKPPNGGHLCIPADPYGWTGGDSDPWQMQTGISSRQFWAE